MNKDFFTLLNLKEGVDFGFRICILLLNLTVLFLFLNASHYFEGEENFLCGLKPYTKSAGIHIFSSASVSQKRSCLSS